MSKYFAVIRDSFREALASRVLWLVLALITLLLLSIAPLGYDEELTWRLGENDVRDWVQLMELVRSDGHATDRRTPAARIWTMLDPAFQTRLASIQLPGTNGDPPNPFAFLGALREFRVQLNAALESPDFYAEAFFPDLRMASSELRQLREVGLNAMSDAELARFNRLILEASFTEMVRASAPTSVQIVYGGLDIGPSFPLRGESLRDAVQSAVSQGMDWFVGAAGILVAILVTAPIIPQMFDPGSLHLLLSKPVSRSLLFLAKFVGGCAFILIAAGYLIAGIWLILGLRFQIWDAALLWSIPIYMFVFTIYYSVAALVGAVWRSPIVVIALTFLFWAACFVIGWSKLTFETVFWSKARVVQILEAGSDVLMVNETGLVHQWDPLQTRWNEIFVSAEQRQASGFMLFIPTVMSGMRPIGPVYDPKFDRLISIHPTFPPRPPNTKHLYVGHRADGWAAVSNLKAPAGAIGLFREDDGALLVASNLGISRLAGDPLEDRQPVQLFGWTIPLGLGGPFENVSPDPPVLLTSPADAAFDQRSGRLAVYTRATVTLLAQSEGRRFETVFEIALDGEERQPAAIALGGETIAVGREDGRLQFYDAGDGTLAREEQLEGRNQPRFIVPSPSGERLAIVFHNGHLWIYEPSTGTLGRPAVAGQGDISAVAFSGEQLLVADRTIRVSRYRLSAGDNSMAAELMERYSPRFNLLERGYNYGLIPLYTIFPKPGELKKTIRYLLSGRETERVDSDDLATAQYDVDPWSPVWSSALFVLVMLLISCVYIERQEF